MATATPRAKPGIAAVTRTGIVILDVQGIVQSLNEPSAQLLGVRPDEVIDMPLSAILGETASLDNLAALARASADRTHNTALQGLNSDLALTVSLMRGRRDRPIGYVCKLRDVTACPLAQHLTPPTATDNLQRQGELRGALNQRELVVHYQPIVELRRGAVTGFEALVRWQHPRLGLLAPGDFLPLAEAAGQLGAIDQFVLEQACADLPRLRAESGSPTLFVSVNQGTAALSDPALARRLSDTVTRHRLKPKDVRIELLENTVVVDAVRDTLRELRERDFGVCIDDFGTGHSSLSRLHDVPATGLKIDRAFVRAMLVGKHGRKIIGSIVALAHGVNLGVIAEGVTTPAQVELLREMGCGHAQGYLFSPPLPVEEAIGLVRRRNAERDRRSQVLEARVAVA